MRFWDSSALVPLLIQESDTDRRREQLADQPDCVVWAFTQVECASALTRQNREGNLTSEALAAGFQKLTQLSESWVEVNATKRVRQRAMRLLRQHPLCATDSLQLAAALVVCRENPETLEFVSGDKRLLQCAESEGFKAIP